MTSQTHVGMKTQVVSDSSFPKGTEVVPTDSSCANYDVSTGSQTGFSKRISSPASKEVASAATSLMQKSKFIQNRAPPTAYSMLRHAERTTEKAKRAIPSSGSFSQLGSLLDDRKQR